MRQAERITLKVCLWLAGPLIAYLALPIEGEFWVSLMPTGNHNRAYALCLLLDIVGELFIYYFSRIQQTAARNTKRYRASWGILAFSGVTVIASWGVAFQQLLKIADMTIVVAALNALIQPATQLGVGYTQAVLEGKFDSESRTETHEPKRRRATRAEWRKIAHGLNGDRANLDAGRVNEILDEHGYLPNPLSTARDWTKDVRNGEQNA